MTDNSGVKNKSKVVVITGSSKGIGKAIAKEFAMSGYSLVLNARNKDELEQTTNELTKEIMLEFLLLSGIFLKNKLVNN